MKTINVKGNGPQQEAAVKAAVERGETELEVLLDNPVSASAVMRFLEGKGFGVQLQDDEGTIKISARKGKQPSAAQLANPVYEVQPIARPNIAAPRQAPLPKSAPEETLSVLVTRCALGSDHELGETLMKNFLSALAQMERPPLAVALMNDGVKLAVYHSSSCDHLKNLERKGVSVLISGTCANYFNIMDEIGAGSISGMPEILETASMAGKVITL